MAEIDKNAVVTEYLMQCPSIKDNPLFFNFAESNDDTKQLLITANDKKLNKVFVDGSEQKRFTFTIIDYRSVAYQALTEYGVNTDENVEEMLDVQSIIDWISQQNKLRNYPDFGSNCIIDSMTTTTDNPNFNGVDTNVQPSIAKYHISIVIKYVDTSEAIWNQ